MRSSAHRSAVRMRGLTLVETLLVIVLLGMIMTVGTVRLASADAAARLDRTLATVRDIDGKARLLALESGAVRMRLEHAGTRLVLVRGDDEVLADRQLDHDVALEFYNPGGRFLETIVVDGRGVSADYTAVVRHGGGELQRRLFIYGLSGQVRAAGLEGR